MSQVTDGDQVKKKKKGKRDSLMLFRPLVRCVGRPFCCPSRGESVCAVTVSKNGGARFLPGEGRKGERRNSRTKVETSRPTRGKDAREILLHPPLSVYARAYMKSDPVQLFANKQTCRGGSRKVEVFTFRTALYISLAPHTPVLQLHPRY